MDHTQHIGRLGGASYISNGINIVFQSGFLKESVRRLLRRVSLTAGTVRGQRRRARPQLWHFNVTAGAFCHPLVTLQRSFSTHTSGSRHSGGRGQSGSGRQGGLLLCHPWSTGLLLSWAGCA